MTRIAHVTPVLFCCLVLMICLFLITEVVKPDKLHNTRRNITLIHIVYRYYGFQNG